MPRMTMWALAAGLLLAGLAGVASPASVNAHAALERSDPGVGASLPESPAEIRLTFTEPLESAFTGADLLDGAGAVVPGAAASIAPDNDHELVLVPATPLADGNYTVAWRTLSAADGHTLQGYFGFAVGAGFGGSSAVTAAAAGSDTARALSRGLALLGLAALLALPPLSLVVFAQAVRAAPGLELALEPAIRRYAVAASLLAVLGSLTALGVQAATTANGASFLGGIARTLADTRYGYLWQIRLLLLVLVVTAVAIACWGAPRWRVPALAIGTVAAFVAPLPFSLISHAAAQQEARSAAVAADALHLLAAAIWAGGLLMLVFVLLPALRPLLPDARLLALRSVLPRFSAIALAAWAAMVLSGLYAAWLQVGTLEALRTTDYGQTLLLKGALLVPVLALAAFHFALGKTTSLTMKGAGRFAATIAAEALLVAIVLLVVGRLIGLEPAREILSARTPSHLTVPLSFPTDDGPRAGQLTITPGAAGANDFLLEIEGSPLSEDAEGVLRFTPPTRDLGTQELILPMREPNAFQIAGSELALPGEWRVETIVRAIGDFSWSTESVIPVGQTPPLVPDPNPAPLFAPPAIAGMLAVAAGAMALAVAVAGSGHRSRRAVVAALGVGVLAAGATVLSSTRLPAPEPMLAAPPTAPALAASPSSEGHEDHSSEMMHGHASPAAGDATPRALPGLGTAVQADGYTVELAADPTAAGPLDITVILRADDGSPLEGARVVVLSEMPEMGMGRTETRAIETAPGEYVAASVPLVMPGEWHLSVRVSPRGEPTQVMAFAVTAP